MGSHKRSSTQRQRLAHEAARIIAEQGVQDYDRARRKAAERAGVGDRRCWPNNEEIHQALLEHRRLFLGEQLASDLRLLREQALKAMRAFARFTPRLVGPVLSGTGNSIQGVRLNLFTDNSEELVLALIEQGIPWQQREETHRYTDGHRRTHPVLTFLAGETPFELLVLPLGARHSPPLDPVSERPEKGAGIPELERILEEDGV